MPAIDSATGKNLTTVTVGQNLTDTATASSTATAAATSVEQIAAAGAVVTQDVGILDSTVNVGGNATLTVNETGVATGSATTVNRTNLAATGAVGALTNVALGDRVIDQGTGLLKGYVIDAAVGTLSDSPGGATNGGVAAVGDLFRVC